LLLNDFRTWWPDCPDYSDARASRLAVQVKELAQSTVPSDMDNDIMVDPPSSLEKGSAIQENGSSLHSAVHGDAKSQILEPKPQTLFSGGCISS